MDRLFVDDLLRMDSAAEARACLATRPELANRELIEHLRERVNQMVRVDITEAARIAERTQSLAEMIQDPLASALACRAGAQALWAQGRYEEALDGFRRAEHIYQSLAMDREAAGVARSQVTVLMYLGRYREALAVADQARAVFNAYDDKPMLAQLDTNVGNIYHRLDEYGTALEYYDRARAVFADTADTASMGMVELNRANVLSMLSRIGTAAALYETSRDLLQRSNMPVEAAKAEYNLAYLLYIQRNYNESIRLFGQVKEFYRQAGNPLMAALCDLDLLEIYLELNLFDDVLSSCDAVEAAFTRFHRRYEVAKVKTYRGLAHLHLKNLPAAERDLFEARQVFAEEGNRSYGALLDLHISVLKLRQGRNEEAEALCRSACEVFSTMELPLRVAYARLLMARAAFHRGDREAAHAYCGEILRCLAEHPAPWLAFQCHHLLGNLAAPGNSEGAYHSYKTSIEYIEGMCAHIRPDEFKSAFLKDKLKVYEDMINLCLARGTAETRAEAFSWVERAKSRSLVDLLSCTAVDPSAPSDASGALHQRWKGLREELNWLYDRINHQAPPSDQRDLGIRACLQGEIQVRERAMADLLRQSQLDAPEFRRRPAGSRVGPQDVREYLHDDEALLEFYFANDTLKTFIVTKDGLEVISNPIRRDTLSRAVLSLQFQWEKFLYGPSYTTRHGASLRRSANHYLRELYRLLLEPLQPRLEGKHLVIIPHDLLHYVPFHALLTGEDYVIDRHEVSYAPSASVFRLCQQKHAPASDRVLVLGAPGRTMSYVEAEAQRIHALFPDGRLLVRETATREALCTLASDSRIIHIAAHGLFRYDNPLFSALRLSDAWLSFYDVYGLHLNADLVTLSGCHSGLSQVVHGDELLGLMRGFLYAGAASLVASLWGAHDRSTAAFMELFYQALKAGVPKRAALRQAALTIRSEFDHPYHWAPFVLVGKR